MGDYFQKFSAPDVMRSDAAGVAARVRMWLQQERIIGAEPSDCVLGHPAGGYRPGPDWKKAVAHGRDAHDGFLGLLTNGVEIVDAPVVYYTIDADPFEAVCPRCGTRCSSDFVDNRILSHIGAWQAGDDTIVVACPHCAGAADLLAWRVNHIALAHFGLVFWNWPRIADNLIAGLGRHAGSHIIALSGKL